MKRLGKVILILAGAYLILMLASGLAIKALLSGSLMQTFLAAAESRLPAPVTASGASFSLTQWLLFRPAVTIRDLSVGNPAGFSSEPMLTAREASAQVALLSLFQDQIDILRFTLREPVINIESSRSGATNIEALASGASKGGASGSEEAAALLISSLSVESGTLRYQRGGSQGLTVRDIDLSLEDFSADKTCRMSLAARLFGGKSSRLDFQGRAGPAGERTLPASGDLSVVLAPAEIPTALRDEYFGDLLREPGSASRAALQANMQGNLMEVLQGEGKLSLSGFQLGKNSENRVALEGEAPLRITARRLLADPSFELLAEKATLQLGQGRWSGRSEVSYGSGRIQGGSSGSITGVRINEMLSAFTSTEDAVFGLAQMPDYRIQFAGENAKQVLDSLSGQGKIRIEDGRITLFNLLDTVRRGVEMALTGAAPPPGQTDFTRFASSFEIRNGKVFLSDLVLEHASSVVSGQGDFGFDHSLNFDLVASLTGNLAARLGGRPDSSGQPRLQVPVRVRGTTESPKVYPDVGGMAKQKAVEKARGLLDSLFKKKEEQPK